MRMKNDFHIKGWAPTLVLKQRSGGTRKWPIWSRQQKLLIYGLLISICYRLHHKYVNTDSSLQEAIASYRLRYRPLRLCFCSRLVKPLFFGLKHTGFKAAPNSSCIKWRYSSRPSFYKHDPKWRLKMHYCTLWRSLWRLRELSTIDIIILFNI